MQSSWLGRAKRALLGLLLVCTPLPATTAACRSEDSANATAPGVLVEIGAEKFRCPAAAEGSPTTLPEREDTCRIGPPDAAPKDMAELSVRRQLLHEGQRTRICSIRIELVESGGCEVGLTKYPGWVTGSVQPIPDTHLSRWKIGEDDREELHMAFRHVCRGRRRTALTTVVSNGEVRCDE